MDFWFRRKYNLPPTDPRYLDATVEQMMEDFYAHRAIERPNEVEDEDEDFDQAEILSKLEDDPSAWEELLTLPKDLNVSGN